jgi:hypothetical protein
VKRVDKRNGPKVSVRTASQTRNKKRFARRTLPIPRSLGPKFTANRTKAEQLAALVAQARRWIARGREANIEVGRVFLLIKAIVGHGQWERYYADTFGSCGIAKRTAQEYMELARREDANSKSAESAHFPRALDPQAVTTRKATAKAEVEVGTSAQLKSTSEPTEAPFNLQVRMSTEMQQAVSNLRQSPSWPVAQRKLVAHLKQLCIEFGFFDKELK